MLVDENSTNEIKELEDDDPFDLDEQQGDEEDDLSIDDDEVEAQIEEEISAPASEAEQEIADEEEKTVLKVKKRDKRKKLKEFIDDEAELSDDGEFSEDELESSGDDEKIDTDLVDLDAKELDSDEEEDVRRLYHKQIETEDRRALLLLQEQLEENQVVGQQRRRKFRWQAKEIMENSLRRHYDPDDEESQDTDDDDDIDYSEYEPRLKRPTAETILSSSSRLMSASKVEFYDDDDESSLEAPGSYSKSNRYADGPVAGCSVAMSDDSNSNLTSSRLTHGPARTVISNQNVDLNKFLFRDRELVEALSTKETIIATREEKERTIQRELKRVLQSKSIFDQLYS